MKIFLFIDSFIFNNHFILKETHARMGKTQTITWKHWRCEKTPCTTFFALLLMNKTQWDKLLEMKENMEMGKGIQFFKIKVANV